MATEAGAVISGGFAFLDVGRVLHVLGDQNKAAEVVAGAVVKFEGQHAYGYSVISAGQNYEQLVINVHEDSNLTEKFE